jgi:predicted acyltransferase
MTSEATVSVIGAKIASKTPARLMSLDALRGFDMFWIVGADAIVEALHKVSDNRFVSGVAEQLEHVGWHGFHFEDLIFPMFVFIVGVSTVFSLDRMIEREGRGRAVLRIVRRAALLYVLGVISYGGFHEAYEKIRLLGVLQRIALAYLFTGLIYCFFDWRGRLAWCVGLLVGYWALMTFVPVPDGTAGDFREGHNLANWIDSQYLPLWKWEYKPWDPEGLLSTLPAIANCLIGTFAGMLLRDSKRGNRTKVLYLIAAGVVFVAAGWLWDLQFPVIKKIWTSSFVLVACGYSCLLLAAFHFVIEELSWRRWAMPFVWIGANPITIYLVHEVVDFDKIAERFVGGQLGHDLFGDYRQLAVAATGLLLVFALCRFLYKRNIFIRL